MVQFLQLKMYYFRWHFRECVLFAAIMNWRIIVGLILLILGIRAFYIATLASGATPLTTKFATVVWIVVGVYLVVKGVTMKKDTPGL